MLHNYLKARSVAGMECLTRTQRVSDFKKSQLHAWCECHVRPSISDCICYHQRQGAHMSSGVLVALLILAGSPQPQNAPELISVLHRATEYVANYEAELGNLIGSEEYVQDATWLSTTTRGGYPTVVNRSRRPSKMLSTILLKPTRNVCST